MVMVSVIIPSFDRLDRLLVCVKSVARTDPKPRGGLQIIVVASRYSSSAVAAIEGVGASVLEIPHRALSSESRNEGAELAAGDFLLFLDDDNVLAPDAIWRLSTALEAIPDAVLVGPLMYYGDQPERIWCAGVERSSIFMRTRLRSTLPHPCPPYLPSDDLPNCFMVRSDEFRRIGGFDVDRFPHHMAEADLAQRLTILTAKRVLCVPQAHAWHHIGTSFFRRIHIQDAQRAYWVSRSRTTYVAIYGNTIQWYAYIAASQWILGFVSILAILIQSRANRRSLSLAYMRGLITGLRLGLAARHNARTGIVKDSLRK
jgi:GT2 family glycosyltransferase